jgi:hypothetical protein
MEAFQFDTWTRRLAQVTRCRFVLGSSMGMVVAALSRTPVGDGQKRRGP